MEFHENSMLRDHSPKGENNQKHSSMQEAPF